MRFVPNDFQYNGRLAAALVHSLAVLAGFGGKYPVGALLVSSQGTTVVGDLLHYRLIRRRRWQQPYCCTGAF